MNGEWYVMQDEQSLGPYTPEQMSEFAAQGNIARDSMVWTEGLESWVPAAQVDGLFPAETASVPPTPAAAQAAPAPAAAELPSAYPPVQISSVSFGIWLGAILLGVFLMCLPGLVSALSPEEPPEQVKMILVGLFGIGVITILVAGILSWVYLHHAWKCLRPGQLARTTPGKAVGFLFIPFFNLYWIFQAVYGLAVDWNRTIAHYPDLQNAPNLPAGLALGYCITALVFPPVAAILGIILVARICRGINYFAFRPRPGSGPGGFVLG